MSDDAFMRPRAFAAIAACMAIAFALSMLLTLKGAERIDDSVGANSFSRSAIGHRGFYELLGALGVRAARDYGERADGRLDAAALVLAEPFAAPKTLAMLKRLEEAQTVLLVLPKRRAWRDPARSGWAAGAELVLREDVNAALATVDTGKIARFAKPSAFSTNLLGAAPTLAAPTQLIVRSRLDPIVASLEGVLLGETRRGGRRILVLADPDVIANHGLAKGDNAAFVAQLSAMLGGARIVFNEAIHGATGDPQAPPPDLLSLLARFPYPLVAVQALLGLALLLAATMGRFGAPSPSPRALASGKRRLIANTAQLLDYGGHRATVSRRYVEVVIRDVARRLHAPRQLDEAALIQWLQRRAKARGVTRDCGAIFVGAPKIDEHGAVAAAQAIHAWKTEMLDGHAGHRRDH